MKFIVNVHMIFDRQIEVELEQKDIVPNDKGATMNNAQRLAEKKAEEIYNLEHYEAIAQQVKLI